MAKQHQKLSIASEQQLDDSQVNKLLLFHLSVAPIEGHESTLPWLVDQLRNRVGHGVARSNFDDLLRLAGYLDLHSGRYSKTGYSTREENLFHVTKDFPKIVESVLPAGVGDVRYTVSVDACRPFSIPFEVLDSEIKSIT
jgi:hypothetical protein